MRVSKTVREYITKQVNAKMTEKYAAMIAAEKEQDAICYEVNETIKDKVAQLIFNEIQDAVTTHPFLSSYSGKDYEAIRNGMSYSIGRNVMVRREQTVRSMMNNESAEIVENIIVTLELGGTKADLERMLAEIA